LLVAQQAEGEKITETIRQREEIKVTATKSDGSSEVIKDDVVEAELRRTQPRTDLWLLNWLKIVKFLWDLK